MAMQPDMIGIVVADMGEALGFYRRLGLEIAEGQEQEPYVEVTTPNGYRISWNALSMVKQIEQEWVEPIGHRMELAFRCDSPAEVDAVHASIAAAGYRSHREPWDAFWGQRYAIVEDPDGNRVSLFAPLAGDE